jgi:hypothetical protein
VYQLQVLGKPLDSANGVMKQNFPEFYQKPGGGKK